MHIYSILSYCPGEAAAVEFSLEEDMLVSRLDYVAGITTRSYLVIEWPGILL